MITELEYLNAKMIISEYKKEQAELKLAREKNPEITRNEARLLKVKEMFPIGTKFTSLFGAQDVVTETKNTYWIGNYGDIFVSGKHQERMIYSTGSWAKIHKS